MPSDNLLLALSSALSSSRDVLLPYFQKQMESNFERELLGDKQRLADTSMRSKAQYESDLKLSGERAMLPLKEASEIRINEAKPRTTFVRMPDGTVVPYEGKFSNQSKPYQTEEEKQSERLNAKKMAGQPKVRASLRSSLTELDSFEKKVDNILNSPLSLATGLLKTSFIQGSKGADIAADLDSIKAKSAFTSLQEMRQNSPTGGALGQVSDRENQLLMDAIAALKGSQSEKNLRKNLQVVKDKIKTSRSNLLTGYEEDYGETFKDSTGTKKPLSEFYK